MGDAELKKLNQILEIALNNLYASDAEILENNANERSMSFRLGIYLSNEITKKEFADFINNSNSERQELEYKLSVDSEYNRSSEETKKLNLLKFQDKVGMELPHPQWDEVSIFPDLIVHSRMNDFANILAIEIKKQSNRNLAEWEFDRLKLQHLTSPEQRYQYDFGAFIVLGSKNYSIEYFCNGERLD